MPSGGTDPATRPQLRPIVGGAKNPPAPSATDVEAELVERARAGDLAAWARLYQDHFDAVFRHVCFLCGDPVVAEDLVQETFARAMTHVDRYDGRSAFLGWVRGIALNVTRMYWRRASTAARAHDHLEKIEDQARQHAGQFEQDRAHLREHRMQVLYEVLATLPARLREAFVLRELEGQSGEDVAALLGISVGNVAVRASRARARIRAQLKKRGMLAGGES
jgi:RNA polymerase sigma-70 factor (ECF subfamily)